MTPRPLSIGVVIALMLTIAQGCGKSPEEKAIESAGSASAAAASQKQRQLWQDVADQGGAPGLERVPSVQSPIEQRRGTTAAQPQLVPPQPITLPPSVQNTIRILDHPRNPATSHDGPATVIDAAEDRIQLDLGSKRTLSVLARVGRRSIPVKANETVTAAYVSRRGPDGQRAVIGIRTTSGAGIVHVMESGDNPIEIDVPLFNLHAKQLGSDPGSPVQFSGGPGVLPRDLRPGDVMQVGDATVFVIGSAGVSPGDDPGSIEGRPYALNVMVWKVP